MCFKSSFEGTAKVLESRMEAGILFQVAGEETASECFWPVQGGGSARAQCPRCLMPKHLTRKVSRCTSVDGPERHHVTAYSVSNAETPLVRFAGNVTKGRLRGRGVAWRDKVFSYCLLPAKTANI